MKIKAFSFEQNSFAFADIKRSVLDRFTDSGLYFESISDPNLLFEKISSSLSGTEVLVLGIEGGLYLKFKPILIKAFHFTPAYSEKIEEKIGSRITEEKLKKAHMLVPNESTELVSSDGLYSGFYVKSGEQYIVVFPLKETVVPEILENADLPFIKADENKSELYKEIDSPGEASPKAQTIISKLLKNNIKLAIPTTPASSVLKDDIRGCINYENNVFFTPFVNDAGATDPKEYAAQLARGAMELRSADVGATISNIFQEKRGDTVKSYYSFISVSTEDKVVVRKLFADAGESVDSLLTEATNELYSMIDKYIDEVVFKKNATKEELEKYEKSLIEAEYKADVRPSASITKKGAIIAIVCLALAVVVCIILGFKFGGYFVSPSDIPESSSLQSAGVNISAVQPTGETVKSQNTTNGVVEFSSSEMSTTSIFDANVITTMPTSFNTNSHPIEYNGTNAVPYTQDQDPETEERTEENTKEKTTEKTTKNDMQMTESKDTTKKVEKTTEKQQETLVFD